MLFAIIKVLFRCLSRCLPLGVKIVFKIKRNALAIMAGEDKLESVILETRVIAGPQLCWKCEAFYSPSCLQNRGEAGMRNARANQ